MKVRRTDGSTDPLSEGVLVDAAGEARRLGAEAFELVELGRWTSPLDGAEYPSGWRVEVPGERLSLEVQPVRPDQELNVSVRYWEGAVDVTGTVGNDPVSGRGYVELTGYSPGSPGPDAAGSRRFKPSG